MDEEIKKTLREANDYLRQAHEIRLQTIKTMRLTKRYITFAVVLSALCAVISIVKLKLQ